MQLNTVSYNIQNEVELLIEFDLHTDVAGLKDASYRQNMVKR